MALGLGDGVERLCGGFVCAIGIRDHTDPQEVARLPGVLTLPFKGQITDYAINRRHWSDATNAPDAGRP